MKNYINNENETPKTAEELHELMDFMVESYVKQCDGDDRGLFILSSCQVGPESLKGVPVQMIQMMHCIGPQVVQTLLTFVKTIREHDRRMFLDFLFGLIGILEDMPTKKPNIFAGIDFGKPGGDSDSSDSLEHPLEQLFGRGR